MARISAVIRDVIARHQAWRAGEPGGKIADLRGAELARADLRGVDLAYANMRRANLKQADFTNADLSYANLGGARMYGVNLWGAVISGANLRGADLRYVTFCRCTIDGSVLHKHNIGGPGHILCALTDEEYAAVMRMRGEK